MKVDWQPIETAPKGEDIWIMIAHAGRPAHFMTIVSWRTYHPNAKGVAQWRDVSGIKIDERHLTHWAPLPEVFV